MKLFFEKILLFFQGKKLVLLSIFLTFVITAIGLLAVGYLFKSKYPKLASYIPLAQNEVLKNTNETSKDQKLPMENLLVYERCINGEHNPDFCILYTAELFKPYTEKEVYRYEFTRKDEDPYNTPNRLHLLGVVGSNVVYSAFAKDLSELGLIDNVTGTKSVIKSDNNDNTWDEVYVDSVNSRIYFYICDKTSAESCDLTYFNVLKGKETVVLHITGFPYVRYADADKVYLDVGHMGAAGYDDRDLPKVLNLKDNSLQDMPLKHVFNAISNDGKKVAFVRVEKLDNGWSNQRLIVSDIDGQNEIELFKTVNSYSSPVGNNTEPNVSIQDVQVSPSGSSVLAKVVDTSEKNPSTHFYQWNMGVSNNPDFKPNKGILFLPTGKTPMQFDFKDPMNINIYDRLSLKSIAYRVKDDPPFYSNYKADTVSFTINTGYTNIGSFGPFDNITYLTGLDISNARPIILGASEFMLIP